MGFYEDENEDENLSFARKYRPYDLDGYIGNANVKDTVIRYMRGKKRPQTILLTGNSGCGKTTLGRILEREYCCENRDPEKGACGVCPTCQAFDDYIKKGSLEYLSDIYEVDASENGSKKDIDNMLDTMEYPAMSSAWKCYLIDEAHLLSEGAMGRLLKTFEEPPEGVLILLCTTDPDKLIDTVRNRCQLKLRIEKPTTSEIIGLLKNVCSQEGKEYDLEGLRMLAGRADNVIRDSLNNLETVLSTRGNARSLAVSEQFQQVTDKLMYDFYNAYLNDDYVGYIGVVYKIKTSYGFDQFINSLITFTVRGIYILNSVMVEGMTTEELKSCMDLFKKFSPAQLSQVLRDLKKMSLGNIEANLMSFIYCKGEQVTDIEKLTPEIKESVTLKEEVKFRNSNLEALERAKEEEGRRSIASEMEMVALEDISSMFSLEKVEE